MSREIKFRAWDEENKSMHFGGFSIHATGQIDSLPSLGPYNPVVMQYTGLKDKNGMEIYEGDILKSRRTSLNYQVVWDNEEAQYAASCVEPEKDFIMGAYSWHENKIIGNIHQNPELLK